MKYFSDKIHLMNTDDNLFVHDLCHFIGVVFRDINSSPYSDDVKGTVASRFINSLFRAKDGTPFDMADIIYAGMEGNKLTHFDAVTAFSHLPSTRSDLAERLAQGIAQVKEDAHISVSGEPDEKRKFVRQCLTLAQHAARRGLHELGPKFDERIRPNSNGTAR
jgi:hypothetical protein